MLTPPNGSGASESLRTPEVIDSTIKAELLRTREERRDAFKAEFTAFRIAAIEIGRVQEQSAQQSGDPSALEKVREYYEYLNERLQKGTALYREIGSFDENKLGQVSQKLSAIEQLSNQLVQGIEEYNQFQRTRTTKGDYGAQEIALRLAVENMLQLICTEIGNFNKEFGWLLPGRIGLDKSGPVLSVSKNWPPDPDYNHLDASGGLRKVYDFAPLPGMSQSIEVSVWRTGFMINDVPFRHYQGSFTELLNRSELIGQPTQDASSGLQKNFGGRLQETLSIQNR